MPARKPLFGTWLALQTNRNDAVGDPARDMTMDPFAPARTNSLTDLREYLVAVFAGNKAIAALERAWNEWSSPPSRGSPNPESPRREIGGMSHDVRICPAKRRC